jgi:hypothetical protein
MIKEEWFCKKLGIRMGKAEKGVMKNAKRKQRNQTGVFNR